MFFAALAVPSMAASAPAPKIVIAGAGLHGSALAYYLTRRGVKPIVVEQHSVAAAASGKGGGFLARDWGSGPTTQLHKVSYALHEELAETLGISSYRKIPVLRVSPGKRTKRTTDICPWLDGEIAECNIKIENISDNPKAIEEYNNRKRAIEALELHRVLVRERR